MQIMKKTHRNRRDFLKIAGLGGVGVFTTPYLPSGKPTSTASIPNTLHTEITRLNRFPRMMQEYMVGRVREIEQKANDVRNALSTKDDALRYVENVRAKIRQVLGPWPEKTPLNAHILICPTAMPLWKKRK